MLTGSIASLGSQHVVGLKAIDCNTETCWRRRRSRRPARKAYSKRWTGGFRLIARQAASSQTSR
jgi:hypothetical protein